MGREKGSGMNWKGVDSNARSDKTRQNSFFFPIQKERKLCKKKRGGKCLTFFKGIINSLSALVCIVFDLIFKYI